MINKNHFNYYYIIGKGGYGKVWKVSHKKSDKEFAMKIMLKAKVIDKNSVISVNNEKELLKSMKHE